MRQPGWLSPGPLPSRPKDAAPVPSPHTPWPLLTPGVRQLLPKPVGCAVVPTERPLAGALWGCSQGCLGPGPSLLGDTAQTGLLPSRSPCSSGTWQGCLAHGLGAWAPWVRLVVTPRGGAEVLVPGPLRQLADTTRLMGSSFPSLPTAPVCWEVMGTLLSGGAMPHASSAEDLTQLCSQGLGGPSGGASGWWMAQGAAHCTRACGRHLGDPARSEARAGSSSGSDG